MREVGGHPESLLFFDEDTQVKPRPSRTVLANLPTVVTIDAPAFEGIDGVIMHVMLGNAHYPLYIELNDDNLSYLQAVVKHQIENCEIKRTRVTVTKTDDSAPGTPQSAPATPRSGSPATPEAGVGALVFDKPSNFTYLSKSTTVNIKQKSIRS